MKSKKQDINIKNSSKYQDICKMLRKLEEAEKSIGMEGLTPLEEYKKDVSL